MVELYINQLVSASLTSPLVGLLTNQTASLHGSKFTASANITFEPLTGAEVHLEPFNVCSLHQEVDHILWLHICCELYRRMVLFLPKGRQAEHKAMSAECTC